MMAAFFVQHKVLSLRLSIFRHECALYAMVLVHSLQIGEFDRFHTLVSSLLSEGRNPSEVFNMAQYNLGSEAYLNVFRYFSKILCCQIAEAGGPRPLEACEFAIGKRVGTLSFYTLM